MVVRKLEILIFDQADVHSTYQIVLSGILKPFEQFYFVLELFLKMRLQTTNDLLRPSELRFQRDVVSVRSPSFSSFPQDFDLTYNLRLPAI